MYNSRIEKTSIGMIGIVECDGAITNVCFADRGEFENIIGKDFNSDCCSGAQNQTPLLKEAFRQLHVYLVGNLKEFTLPLAPRGTQFQINVWTALQQIPYGTTVSYKHIAAMVGNPKASRAVGMANNKNPIPIFIPCHRIIGSNGDLIGYRGGLELKRWLLWCENPANLVNPENPALS